MRLVLMMQTSPQEEAMSVRATLLLVHARAMAHRRLVCQVSNAIPLRTPPPISPHSPAPPKGCGYVAPRFRPCPIRKSGRNDQTPHPPTCRPHTNHVLSQGGKRHCRLLLKLEWWSPGVPCRHIVPVPPCKVGSPHGNTKLCTPHIPLQPSLCVLHVYRGGLGSTLLLLALFHARCLLIEGVVKAKGHGVVHCLCSHRWAHSKWVGYAVGGTGGPLYIQQSKACK